MSALPGWFRRRLTSAERGAEQLIAEEQPPALSLEERRARKEGLIGERKVLEGQLAPLQREIAAATARADELRDQIDELTQRIDASGPQGRTSNLQAYLDQCTRARIQRARQQHEKELEWGLVDKPFPIPESPAPVAEIPDTSATDRLQRDREALNQNLEAVEGDKAAAVSLASELIQRIDALTAEIEILEDTLTEQIFAFQAVCRQADIKRHRRRQHLIAMGVRPEELMRRPRRR